MFAVPSFFGYNTTFVSTPVATAATGVGETSFTANWNAFVGASYYLLDVSTSSSFSSFVGSYQNFVVLSTSQLVSGLTASTTYYYRLRAATGVDADAAAFFGRVYTAGGTLTNTEATAVNQLTIDMKAAGIWTAMKAVYPMVGASAAACAQNLKSSSFTGTFSSGWSFDPAGVIPNGTSAYFNTTLAPSGNLTNNSTHISYYSRTDNNAAAVDGVDIGVTGLLANAYLPVEFFRSRTTDQMQTALYNYGSPTFLTPSNTNSLGFFVGNRTSNVVVNSWKNGTKLGTNTNTETQNITTVAQNFYLSALNLDGAAVQFSVRQCAFSSIGDGLTDTQASDFYTAVQTFNTTLSRAIAP